MMLINKNLGYCVELPYTIEITPDDGAWFVQIRELPGCMTEVDEWDEIKPMIEDAKRLWIQATLAHGQSIPEPQGISPLEGI